LNEEIVDAMRRVGESLAPPGAVVNLVVVDDPFIHRINREFREIDKPTNVISFSYLQDNGPSPGGADDVAGEVYVSYQTVEKEANDLGVDPGTMFLRIGVHGLLHVVGFDHAADEDAARMEREEKSILSDLLAPAELDALF